jgi:6-phosphogluconolactonase (cycloisomerase 2 family)
MGLLTGLLTLPLAPVRGVVWVVEQVAEEADRQLYDEDVIRGELLALEIDEEDGKLTRAEREELEEALMARLAVSQARRTAATEEDLEYG